MVPRQQVEQGLARYIDREIISKLPTSSIQRVATGAAVAIAMKRSDNLVERLKGNALIATLGIMNEAGDIDLDALHEALRSQVTDDGVVMEVPILGRLTFYAGDIDNLYSDIMGVSR